MFSAASLSSSEAFRFLPKARKGKKKWNSKEWYFASRKSFLLSYAQISVGSVLCSLLQSVLSFLFRSVIKRRNDIIPKQPPWLFVSFTKRQKSAKSGSKIVKIKKESWIYLTKGKDTARKFKSLWFYVSLCVPFCVLFLCSVLCTRLCPLFSFVFCSLLCSLSFPFVFAFLLYCSLLLSVVCPFSFPLCVPLCAPFSL